MKNAIALIILACITLAGCHKDSSGDYYLPEDTDTEEDAGVDSDADGDTDTETDTETDDELGPYETCYSTDDCEDCWMNGDLGGPPAICSPECDEELGGSDCPEQPYGPEVICLHGHCYISFQNGTGCPEDQVPTTYPGATEVCWPAE